jgi:DNA-binding transcriptional regulator WhiA
MKQATTKQDGFDLMRELGDCNKRARAAIKHEEWLELCDAIADINRLSDRLSRLAILKLQQESPSWSSQAAQDPA